MFRTAVNVLASAAIAGTLMVAPAATASAAPDTIDRKASTQATNSTQAASWSYREANYLLSLTRNTKARYSESYLIRAGYYACARKDAYGLRAQIGLTRTRIVNAVIRDVNRAYFANSNLTAATNVTRATGALGGPIVSLC